MSDRNEIGGPQLSFDPDEVRERYRLERDKRVRADGIGQYVEMSGKYATYTDDPYTERIERAPRTDRVDVAILGGGMAGLLAGAKFRDLGVERICIIEKGGDVGGTWYWNRYPGAQCDVESYIYLPLLEELGYIPSERYAKQPEIFEHLRAIARRYDLYTDALLQTECRQIEWDDDESLWKVTTDRGDHIAARFLVVSGGVLSKPKFPGIPGIDEFAGHMFHTSRWDYDYTGGTEAGDLVGLADKRVAVIGTGATAIQVVPVVGATAKHLYVFQRTPSSVGERNNHPTDAEWSGALQPGWQRDRIFNFDVVLTGGSTGDDLVSDGWTQMFRTLATFIDTGQDMNDARVAALAELADFQTMHTIRERIEQTVGDPATAESLKPWYRMFCKRPCFSDDYLPTFNRPNVTLVDTGGAGVERITPTGVVVDGVEYPVDCIIFATGFEVGTNYTRKLGCEIVGRNGRLLSEKWRGGLRTLHGLQTHEFPNCFFLGATQGAFTVNHNHMLLEQVEHAAFILDEALRRGATRFEITQQAEDEWVAEFQGASMLTQSFLHDCTPGFFNAEGNASNAHGIPAAAYGKGALAFFAILREWRDAGAVDTLQFSERGSAAPHSS